MLGHTNIKTTQIYAKITDTKVGEDMTDFAEKLKNTSISCPSPINEKFRKLSLSEKMYLLNIPESHSIDESKEKRLTVIWNTLSEEEKSSLWKTAFENTKMNVFRPEYIKNKIAVNQ